MNFRLTAFDAFIGKPTGLKILAEEIGWWNALKMGIELELLLKNNSPFKQINQEETLTPAKASSQQQMAPVIGLYQLLLKHNYTKEQAIDIIEKLVTKVAFQFLRYNIPIIDKNKINKLSLDKKVNVFKKFSSRFFNAEAKITASDENTIHFDVHFCHFAYYCNKLDVNEIGFVFCKADKLYFEQSQPDVLFSRTQTVMQNASTCDFRFKVKE